MGEGEGQEEIAAALKRDKQIRKAREAAQQFCATQNFCRVFDHTRFAIRLLFRQ
jgi:hypothetical protein